LALFAAPSSANPLGSILGKSALPAVNEGLVHNVNGWHCRKRYSKRLGWHRHRRACYDDDYSTRYRNHGYGLGVMPFFSFQFSDDDNDRHHRTHRYYKRRHHNNNW
jgi:hypothetical protein